MMQWNSLLSQKRFNKNSPPIEAEVRSEFHKDYDRIVFSSAFRRMGRKAQVHPLSNNDHIHTRLTHSIEVGSVGRSLGLIVGEFLNNNNHLPAAISPQEIAAIVQAACLAHDIGNPPFGHAGEFAIRHWFKENGHNLKLDSQRERNDLEIFEGNAQGFRVVSTTENHYKNGGLRLTYATLGTLMKYPWFSDHVLATSKGKFNFFHSEQNIVENIASELGLMCIGKNQYSRHPLSYLMEAADDICYKILDIEDALELDMLRFDEVSGIFNKLAGNKSVYSSDINENYSGRRRINNLRSMAIENLINNCSEIFISNYSEIMNGNYKSELIKDIDGIAKDGISEAKEVTTSNIFLNRRKIELEIGSYATLETILNAFITAINELKSGELVSFKSQRVLDLMGSNMVDENSSYHECYLRVTDLVSGMTDTHATHVANQLSGRAL
jgi:dGTPase